MRINTSFSTFKKKHQNNKNQIIFYKTDYKNNKDVENIINNFMHKKNSFIFESVEKRRIRGRYTIIGADPDKIWEFDKNKFKKSDFDKFSNDQNINIEKITIDSQNDSKILKEELVKQIYIFPEKQVIVVSDIGLTENYLIYIDKIEHGSITKDSDEYEKYFNLSREEMTKNVFSTYDQYLKNKYNIKINYKALEKVKNYIQ